MRRGGGQRLLLAAALLTPVLPYTGRAASLNLAAVNCAKYENEVLSATTPGMALDPIDTVMWLFGFSVARSGQRYMYGDSLTAFGFALDGECKNAPTSSLLQAVSGLRSKRDNPMDLTRLNCTTFETRHAALHQSDPQSATTLVMWLFGYAVGLSGGHVLDSDALGTFESSLQAECTRRPTASLYEVLNAPNPAVPTH